MYQRLSKSAARSVLNRKNVNHAAGASTANGRLTTSHVRTALHPRTIAPSGRRSRSRCTINSTTSRAG